MNKTVSKILLLVVPILLVILIKPYLDEYEEKKTYDFKVNAKSGELTLDSYKGKVLAIYFGYTYCPDVCPTSLSILSQSLNKIDSQKVKNNFEGLFISVDPDRDKLDALDEYAKYFHPTFKGATSNKENIDDIVSRYKSFYKKVYLENSSMDYSVSHTSYIYFFDKDGKLYKKVDHHTNPNEVDEVLKALL